MVNEVKVVGVTSGVFKVNHRFKCADGSLNSALETEIIYTSANNVSNSIKVIVYEKSLYHKLLLKKDTLVLIEGSLRTFNKNSWGKRIKEVFMQPTKIRPMTAKRKQENIIKLEGALCGNVNVKNRTTGTLVAEANMKVKRKDGLFDYIPIVAFNSTAEELKAMMDGEEFGLKGRIHSRTFNYEYKEDGESKNVKRTALEVGIHRLERKGRNLIDLELHKKNAFPVLLDNFSPMEKRRTVKSNKSPFMVEFIDNPFAGNKGHNELTGLERVRMLRDQISL